MFCIGCSRTNPFSRSIIDPLLRARPRSGRGRSRADRLATRRLPRRPQTVHRYRPAGTSTTRRAGHPSMDQRHQSTGRSLRVQGIDGNVPGLTSCLHLAPGLTAAESCSDMVARRFLARPAPPGADGTVARWISQVTSGGSPLWSADLAGRDSYPGAAAASASAHPGRRTSWPSSTNNLAAPAG